MIWWLLACTGREAVSPAVAATSDGCGRPGEAAVNLPAFEDGVVFQFLTGDREGERSGFRVWSDGRLERMRRDGPWQSDVPLDATRLAALEAVVAEAGLRAHPTHYRPEVLPSDPTTWFLQARDGDGVIAMGGKGCRPALVDVLFEGVAPLLTSP